MTILDSPYSATTTVTIGRVADEGVPICAIARSFRIPSAVVREMLRAELSAGNIVEMPPEDWPVNTSRHNRTSNVSYDRINANDLNSLCRRLFGLTKLQAAFIAVLIKHDRVSRDTMHNIVESIREPLKDETSMKMVDVVICLLRKRLKPFELEIKTLWGFGYFMEPEMRRRANGLLEEFMRSLAVEPAKVDREVVERVEADIG